MNSSVAIKQPDQAASSYARSFPQDGKNVTSPVLAAFFNDLPERVHAIATMRGLGYSYRKIAEEYGISPQAVSLMLSRYRKHVSTCRNRSELRGLSSRASNALVRCGVSTRAAGVLKVLPQMKNCGAKTIAEIERWMLQNADQHTQNN